MSHGSRIATFLCTTSVWFCPASAYAQTKVSESNIAAIVIFLGFVVLSLGITFWAKNQTRSASEFYAANSSITPLQNGLAISGDFMSAATFLGLPALVIAVGSDAIVYAIGAAVGWPIIMMLLAERVRNLGQYTFTDVVVFRLQNRPIRLLASFSSLAIISFYLIAQMVGAGGLIEILFDLPYEMAIFLVGTLMVVYVSIGGMVATTWIQIIKALLLLFGGTLLLILLLASLNFDLSRLFLAAGETHPKGMDILRFGGLLKDPVSAVSLGLAFIFGPAGLPHILMRFFTVADGKASRMSAFYAAGFVGFFQIVAFLFSFGAIIYVMTNQAFLDEGNIRGGLNMAAVHLADYLGGQWLLGFIAAVSFATILAVVAGLTLAAASAISHDLYANVLKPDAANEKTEVFISKISVIAIGILAVMLGLVFKGQNLAFLSTLSLSLAASINFPILLLTLYWRGLTTCGALAGGFSAMVVAISLVVLSKVVWVDVFGNETAIYPYSHPTLFSMLAAFFFAWAFSVTDRSKTASEERKNFDNQLEKSEPGY